MAFLVVNILYWLYYLFIWTLTFKLLLCFSPPGHISIATFEANTSCHCLDPALLIRANWFYIHLPELHHRSALNCLLWPFAIFSLIWLWYSFSTIWWESRNNTWLVMNLFCFNCRYCTKSIEKKSSVCENNTFIIPKGTVKCISWHYD